MTVATRRVPSQMDVSRAGPRHGRGPVRKRTVLRTCSPMLVHMYVLYVRRERAESAAMAMEPALMDKDTLNQTPEYVYVRFPRAFLHLEPF